MPVAIRFPPTVLLAAALVGSPPVLWSQERPEETPSPSLPQAAAVPLRAVRTTPFGDGYFAWSSARCDAEGNAFFLQSLPERRGSDAGGAGPYRPREVLRVGLDGDQTRFEPAGELGFGDLLEARPVSMTLGNEGAIHVLLWVERGHDGEQYVVSFDRTGRSRSARRVPWDEIMVRQMEVFDSGDLLLRGRGPGERIDRLSVLSEDGSLEDVLGWPSIEKRALDLMTRSVDGRVYILEQDRLGGESVVYAVSASGVAAPAFRLPPTPPDRSLVGLHAAGGRLAVAYKESPREEHARARSWIAVYVPGAASAELEDLYGPGPGLPLCYAREGSRDLFTFFGGSGAGGLSLVVMEPDPAGRRLVARGSSAF